LRRHAVRVAAAVALLVGLPLAVGACSDGGDEPDAAPSATLPDTLVVPSPTTGSTASPGGGGPGATEPAGCGLCLTVEVPLRCAGSTVVGTASWVDRGGARAGLLVDGRAVPGDVPPAGPFDVDIPCDGRAHTVVLVVTVPGGGTEQSSFAVRSNPAG
jgi:hypothetical protein